MKERPIPFSGPMVNAILEGKKTQTRRPLNFVRLGMLSKQELENYGQPQKRYSHPININQIHYFWPEIGSRAVVEWKRCPFGQRGDRLWVREPWRTLSSFDSAPPREIGKRAQIQYLADDSLNYGDRTVALPGKKRVARYMCRWMSRINLEITGIRVERLQDISEEDAKAEGIAWSNFGKDQYNQPHPGWHWKHNAGPDQSHHQAKYAFGNLWSHINGPSASWYTNPWVWVVEFKRI